MTNVLLILFAARLVENSAGEFVEAGILPAMVTHIWNSNPILSDGSTLGELLKALVGYHAVPSLSQLAADLA